MREHGLREAEWEAGCGGREGTDPRTYAGLEDPSLRRGKGRSERKPQCRQGLEGWDGSAGLCSPPPFSTPLRALILPSSHFSALPPPPPHPSPGQETSAGGRLLRLLSHPRPLDFKGPRRPPALRPGLEHRAPLFPVPGPHPSAQQSAGNP